MSDWRDPVQVRLTSDGRALPGWQLQVVDPDTEHPVPDGAVGHLLIKGYLTSGYLGDQEQTAAAFTDDGFFRTGDLVSVTADGSITFHSRLKELIKTGGINVSPLEVEALLEEHPAVSQALVIGVPDDQRGEVAVAVVQIHQGAAVSQDELRGYVKGRAASFKVPARVIFRTQESLPKLASGKVARRVLRDEVIAAQGVSDE
ncbi:MAG: Acyl-CoA synthetase (AMP-forming)/AMP-acid ligase, partial [Mycobacterium sp.]|nr:Acyl-CoA synthetase (AMP-forming)/AMP-acid ligase [Mycobacterium sp.]